MIKIIQIYVLSQEYLADLKKKNEYRVSETSINNKIIRKKKSSPTENNYKYIRYKRAI